ncbi:MULTISPECIES: hypothetical protein [unclassified Brevibacillus]|uniref:hypothetical protein n=1 Tax=unclassified Brevibacillus TaxID=2684853 RepID=UPI003567D517
MQKIDNILAVQTKHKQFFSQFCFGHVAAESLLDQFVMVVRIKFGQDAGLLV